MYLMTSMRDHLFFCKIRTISFSKITYYIFENITARAKFCKTKMPVIIVFIFLIFLSVSNGDYLRRLEKIESQLADNTGKLQEILSRLPKGM